MEQGTRGVVLLVWGKRGYGFAAYNLAVSLKYHSPSIPITLIAHPETMKQVGDLSVFDSVIWNETFVTDPGRFKATLYKYLPYDYNLYLDVDGFCFHPYDGLFDRLISQGGHYYTFINEVYDRNSPNLLPQMYWAWKDDIWAHYNFEDQKLPATQSSIQFIKKCKESEELFTLFEQCFDNPIPLERLRHQWGGTQPDELYLNIALALKGLAPHIGDDVMWFGNNTKFRPHQLVHQYYFLSFFGFRGNIRPMFWEYYDATLIKMCASRGGNHVYKQQFIKSDKHANSNRNVLGRNNKPSPPQKQEVKRPGTIHLFMSYFQTGNARRNAELNRVMQINIDCPSITKIFNLGSNYDHPKVTTIANDRPTYEDFMKAVNEHAGDYNIIANSDIYFTTEIDAIKSLDFHNTALALSRYDIKGHTKKLFNYEYSQDTWIFKGQIKPVLNCDFIMGRPGCDNRFAHELVQAGYRVINPSIDIKTYHLHEINERSYTEKDRIHGSVIPVKCETSASYKAKRLLIHQPGKVGDIIIVAPIALHYSRLGYEVDWLAPKEYHQLINQLGYAHPIDTKQDSYQKEIDLSFGLIQNTSVHIWWTKNRDNLGSFVTAKYQLAQVDISQLCNLEYKRNEKNENDLFRALGLDKVGDYILCHRSSDYGTPIDISSPYPVVDFTRIGDYTIFDWRKVIEGAKEIHAIDSSLINFADKLNPKGKLFWHKSDRDKYKWNETILINNWTRVNLLEYANS